MRFVQPEVLQILEEGVVGGFEGADYVQHLLSGLEGEFLEIDVEEGHGLEFGLNCGGQLLEFGFGAEVVSFRGGSREGGDTLHNKIIAWTHRSPSKRRKLPSS